MASRGSVIPLFIDQIKAGRPLTVTDPHMTRYMMTLEDAVDLVLFAWEHGENGDLFVQKAPAATIETLAKAVIELAREGTKLRELALKAEIKVIGTRHGEKKYETLVTREEMSKAVDMGDYYRIPADSRDLNYDKYFVEGREIADRVCDSNSDNTARLDLEGMKRLLLKLPVIHEEFGV
jgi:UDP-glucose 4-epimerase